MDWIVTADETIVPQGPRREIELVQHWKHGWIPLTPEAVAIKAKRKSGHLKSDGPTGSGKLTVADALANDKLPPALRNKNLYADEADHHKAIQQYLDKFPEGWSPAKAPESPKPKANAPKAKPGAKKSKPTADADSLAHMSPAQKSTWDLNHGVGEDDDPNSQQKLTKEWEQIDTGIDHDSEALTALDWWSNGQDEYSGMEYYQLVNNLRRAGRVDSGDSDVDQEVRDLDASLTRALAKSRITRDVTLFRGITTADKLEVGDTLTDPGWAATSYNPITADAFRQSTSGKMLVIHAPKGTPALRIREQWEHEVLFGPGTSMRVTKVDGDEIHVRVEPRRK